VNKPVPYWDMEGLRYVRDLSSVPIMADESLHSPHELRMLAGSKGAKATSACDQNHSEVFSYFGTVSQVVKLALQTRTLCRSLPRSLDCWL